MTDIEVNPTDLQEALIQLRNLGLTPEKLVLSLLRHFPGHQATAALSQSCSTIFDAFAAQSMSKDAADAWGHKHMKKIYAAEIRALADKSAGLHFSAAQANSEKLEAITTDLLAGACQKKAPLLCEMMDLLLDADPNAIRNRAYQRNWRAEKMKEKVNSRSDAEGGSSSDRKVPIDESSPRPQGTVGDVPAGSDESRDGMSSAEKRMSAEEKRLRRNQARKMICLNILAQSNNQRCNALQAMLSVFLHSCNTPTSVIQFACRIGLSLSETSSRNIIDSLSEQSCAKLQESALTLRFALGYDNIDIDLPHATPTVEQDAAGPTLIHLTSGTVLPLHPEIDAADLQCSPELWERSPNNQDAPKDPGPYSPPVPDNLIRSCSSDSHSSGLSSHQRFNLWLLLRDLVDHGGPYFENFRDQLEKPEVMEQITLTKTEQIPAKMMDTPCSKPEENWVVIENLLGQLSVGDKEETDAKTDRKNMVILVHGDLGVGERLQSLFESRSLEEEPWNRVEFIIWVPGLFHVKMACVDAIHRIFILPSDARNLADAFTLMQCANIIRPGDKIKIETKPGFRRMHEIVLYVGIITRLAGWREEARKLPGKYASLAAFAESKPTWAQLQAMAETITRDYIAESYTFEEIQRKPLAERDQVRENMQSMLQIFGLYEEISHAMNEGDIKRVETCLLPWTWIWKACGKHKYAAAMQQYLYNIHYNYPKKLAAAIRKSILINPSGKPGKFRAGDWLIEHNNLYLKRVHGGKFSNHTKEYILKESALIGVFKQARIQVETMFNLPIQTTNHSGPKMELTFRQLATALEDKQVAAFFPGRTVQYVVPNVMKEGKSIMDKAWRKTRRNMMQAESNIAEVDEAAEGGGTIDDTELAAEESDVEDFDFL